MITIYFTSTSQMPHLKSHIPLFFFIARIYFHLAMTETEGKSPQWNTDAKKKKNDGSYNLPLLYPK